jgi:iron complex transport system substrate-binding protein
VFWYDNGDPPSAGACCGVPDEIIRLAGAENVFKDTPGSWKTVSWEEVVARNPDAIVLVDASWSPAAGKRVFLTSSKAFSSIEAIKAQRFVTIDFSASTPGIRIVAAVRKLAEALYPGQFR